MHRPSILRHGRWRVYLAAAAFNVLHPCPRCGSWGVDRLLGAISLLAGLHLAWPWWDTLGSLPAYAGMRVLMGDYGWSLMFGGGALVKLVGMAAGLSRVRWLGSLALTFAWTSAAVALVVTGPHLLGAPVFLTLALAQLTVSIRTTRSGLWSRRGA